jgi:hypothetical protein
MSSSRHRFVAAALLCACIGSSPAADLPLAADGQWAAFNVNELDALSLGVEWISNDNTLSPDFGTPLFFDFTIAAGFKGVLTVVDAGFAGDSFLVTNHGALLGGTSAVPLQDALTAPDLGTDFGAALADAQFSRGVFALGAGSYRIGGQLAQSVMFDGVALNATVGAVSLTVTAIPEPQTWALLAAGLGIVGSVARRRQRA